MVDKNLMILHHVEYFLEIEQWSCSVVENIPSTGQDASSVEQKG